MEDDLDAIEERVGHKFGDRDLLRQALTHPSCNEGPNYQRLEFVGDRVLGTLIAHRLYREYPETNEGGLAIRFNELVRRETLANVMLASELDAYIRLSPGEEESGGREKPAILADCCEAVIGALYLDGGLDAAAGFVRQHWIDLVDAVATKEKDAKTRLQEWAQGRGLARPSYQVVSREGPAHEPRFTITVVVGKEHQGTGKGGSKRAAEQEAAQALLDHLSGMP